MSTNASAMQCIVERIAKVVEIQMYVERISAVLRRVIKQLIMCRSMYIPINSFGFPKTNHLLLTSLITISVSRPRRRVLNKVCKQQG